MKKWPAVIALAAIIFASAMASAKASNTLYRYWSYWHSSDSISWTYSSQGASRIPADGSVEGWYFAVTSKSPGAEAAPPIRANFKEYCKATKPAPGMKRVATVISFGKTSYQPRGETMPVPIISCAQVPANATGYDVLAKVSQVRADSVGFICAINGYPANECGGKFVPGESPKADGPNWGIRILNFGLSTVLLILIYRRIAARRRGGQ